MRENMQLFIFLGQGHFLFMVEYLIVWRAAVTQP